MLFPLAAPCNKGNKYEDFMKESAHDCIYFMTCTKSPSSCNTKCNKYTLSEKLKK